MESVDAVRRRLEVEIPAEEVASEVERAYDQLRRQANVRGFRRGRVPRSVLERLFGDRVRAEVHEKLVHRSFHEALRDQRIEPIGRPEIVTRGTEPGMALSYSATVEVKPTIALGEYAGLEADRPLRTISEQDVDRSLESLRQSFAELVPIADRDVVAEGDVATIDYEARVGSRVIGRGHDRRVEAGGNPDEGAVGPRLLGLACGKDSEFEIDYPEDHADAELAGRRVSFRVKVKHLAAKDVPALDDEFARTRTGSETIAELRQRVRAQLELSAASDADAAVRAGLLDRLVQGHDFDVPRAMVERRTSTLVEEVLDGLGPRRPPASREEELRRRLFSDLEPRARDQVKAELVLEAIASREGLEVSAPDLEARIERMVEQAGRAREQVRALYAQDAAREGLRDRLLQERALDLVVERARIRTIESTSGVAGERRNR